MLQRHVQTHRGIKRLDAYWEEYRLGCEIDGKRIHAREKDFEVAPWRTNAIMATSVPVISFTVNHVMNHRPAVLEDCEANLLARCADLGLPIGWPTA